jgi:hypothetical protein
MINGRAAVGAGPDQLQHGIHQSLFGITNAAHKNLFLFVLQLGCPKHTANLSN